MIEARNLVKRYGSTLAVNDLSLSIQPGMITGFLGRTAPGTRYGTAFPDAPAVLDMHRLPGVRDALPTR